MSEKLVDRAELDFLVWDWLRLEEMLAEGFDRTAADAMLDLATNLAAERFLPLYKRADQTPPTLDETGVHVLPEFGEAMRAYAEAGLFGAGFSEELGGLGLPNLLVSAALAQFMAANVSGAAYPMLTMGNARLIATFGSPAQIDAFARPEIEGRWFGTMCLSEPQAGSNLGDITTRATREGEDQYGARYRLVGNKMWISAADHDLSENIVHLVLAKAPDAEGRLLPGTKGISLFIVPKVLPSGERNDVVVAGLNHKMGYRGTSNCLLNLGEGVHKPQGGAGAVGWLVGSEGQGLPQMFQMMNEARLNVGLGAAALGYRGYRHALAYARERRQGRRPNAAPSAPMAPIIGHPDVKDMVLASKVYGEGALALVFYCSKLVDEAEHDRAALALLGLLTPVAKTWTSEYGLAADDLAIQVHGGYGYTQDFDVEQLWRDNRLNPIHEGTTGIQALDLVGRKIARDDAGALAELRRRVTATLAAAQAHEETRGLARALEAAWRRTEEAIATLKQAGAGLAEANATCFLRAFGHTVVAWLWLDQAVLCAGARDPFRQGKVWCARYMIERELPKLEAWLRPVEEGSDLVAAVPEECL